MVTAHRAPSHNCTSPEGAMRTIPRALLRRTLSLSLLGVLASIPACRQDSLLAPKAGPSAARSASSLTALVVKVNGPSKIQTQGTYSWDATVTGATGTISYQWQVSSDQGATWHTVGGNSSTYSRLERRDESFWLRCTAAAGTQSGTSISFKVEVVLVGGP
jgi:hypothetical protein